MKVSGAFVSLILFSQITFAVSVTPVGGLGLDFGGEKMVGVTYSDGSKSDIEAGRGVHIHGGALTSFGESLPNFELQTTIGVKWTSTKQATNGVVDYLRWPVEALAFYRLADNSYRVGGGITYQFNNELKGSKDASAMSLKLKDTLGYVVQGEFFPTVDKKLGLGLRYTSVTYEAKDLGGSVKGDSFGFSLTQLW